MNGIVTGGWNFVWAAYTVSAIILVAYSIHTINGFRKTVAKWAALDRKKGVSP